MSFKMVLAYLGISVILAIMFVTAGRIFINLKRQNKMPWMRMSFILAFLSGLAVFILSFYYPDSFPVANKISVGESRNLILLLVAVLPAAIITVLFKPQSNAKLPLVINIADGMAMELLMRLLVQNLFLIAGATTVVFGEVNLAILFTALIFPQFMLIQDKFQRNPITLKILPELIASMWFSIWVGVLYFTTGNILLPMIAHGLERLLVQLMGSVRNKKTT